MSDDYSSDEYHEDTLPDLVLTTSQYYHRDKSSYTSKTLADFELGDECDDDVTVEDIDFTFPPDLINASADPTLDIQDEYFSTEQISSTYGSSGIRISYSDHTKVYVPKISAAYRSFLNLTDVTGPLEDDTCSNETGLTSTEESLEHVEEQFNSLTLENKEKLRDEWNEDLLRTQLEIVQLRKEVLMKIRKANNLKRKIGITAWREFSSDFKEGLKKLQESEAYSKIETRVSDITESIDEFKNLMKKDLSSIKLKATKELATVKDKATKELATAKDTVSKELATAKDTVSKELLDLQKKASTVLGTPESIEGQNTVYEEKDNLSEPLNSEKRISDETSNNSQEKDHSQPSTSK